MIDHDQNPNEMVEFEDVVVKRDSKYALLCEIDGEEYWIPKSQIKEGSEIKEEGDKGDLIIPEWLAIERGLI